MQTVGPVIVTCDSFNCLQVTALKKKKKKRPLTSPALVPASQVSARSQKGAPRSQPWDTVSPGGWPGMHGCVGEHRATGLRTSSFPSDSR